MVGQMLLCYEQGDLKWSAEKHGRFLASVVIILFPSRGQQVVSMVDKLLTAYIEQFP